MSNKVRADSGDAYHAWEEPEVTRQGFANARVSELQRRPGIKIFAILLKAFRDAGWEYDQWQRQRGAA